MYVFLIVWMPVCTRIAAAVPKNARNSVSCSCKINFHRHQDCILDTALRMRQSKNQLLNTNVWCLVLRLWYNTQKVFQKLHQIF